MSFVAFEAMETPSSMRARSLHTSVASDKSKKRNGKIEYDSPIVGITAGSLAEKTPSCLVAKSGGHAMKTPGSGESLLRGQVKNILQKVEENAVLVSRPHAEECPSFRDLLTHLRSLGQLLAPTPSNTPLISALSDIDEDGALMNEVLTNMDYLKIPTQVVEINPHECEINRALQFDSPNKSEVSDCSESSVIAKESSYLISSPESNNSSAWSVESHTGFREHDNDEEEEDCYEAAEVEEGGEEDEERLDVLSEGVSKMSVNESGKMPQFAGKHTRFVYNSDDQIEGEEEVGKNPTVSPNMLLLKGMPVPEGKHLRFQEDEED